MRQRADSAGWVGAAVGGPATAALRRVGAECLRERERWPLWLPAGFGAGIGAYFALPAEPPVWLGTAGVAFALLLAVAGRPRPGPLLAALALAAVAGGFAVAQLRTQQVDAPVLQEEVWAVDVVARVRAVEPRGDGHRLLLSRPEIEDIPPARTPARIRVTVALGAPDIAPGQRVRLLATLRPPPEPASPGAFDFARRAFFERLGAVGFALGRVESLSATPAGARRWDEGWAALRHAVAQRVLSRLDGAEGALATALMTGERGAIPTDVREDMRRSGLAHLLAISGLHLGLVAGLVFASVRAGLALIPAVALRWPIKKWAAATAVVAAAAYMLLVGATVPTQRAFAMTALVLLGVALDRQAVSMRLVAWAAMAVLVFRPESLLGASFQMSFAAVTALVATYETIRGRAAARPGRRSAMGVRLAVYLGGIALTSVVAIAATTPFAAFHFNRVALYGLAANIVAVPLTAFWVMPWALAAFLAMPLGWEGIPLRLMGWGIGRLITVADSVAGWPGAVAVVSSAPTAALAVVTLGGLWLCLWTRPWRLLGLVPVALGIAGAAATVPPDVLVSGDGRLMAVRGTGGTLWLSSLERKRFSADIWRRRAGRSDVRAFAAAGPQTGLTCDSLGCILRREGHVVALVRDGRALAEDCRRATILISLLPVGRHDCPGPIRLIDRFDLWREGGHAVWLSAHRRAEVETVRDHSGRRPWVRRRGRDQ